MRVKTQLSLKMFKNIGRGYWPFSGLSQNTSPCLSIARPSSRKLLTGAHVTGSLLSLSIRIHPQPANSANMLQMAIDRLGGCSGSNGSKGGVFSRQRQLNVTSFSLYLISSKHFIEVRDINNDKIHLLYYDAHKTI
jgi:hypothetical protein